MSEFAAAKVEEGAQTEFMSMWTGLFEEWLAELTSEEKQIWLWNSLVEMMRIKQRREYQQF